MRKLFVCIAMVFMALPGLATETPEVRFESSSLPTSGNVGIVLSSPTISGDIATQLNQKTDNRLQEALDMLKLEAGEKKELSLFGIAPYQHIFVTILGNQPSVDKVSWQDIGGAKMAMLRAHSITTPVAIVIDIETQTTDSLAHFALGSTLRGYQFNKYKKTSAVNASPNIVIHTPLANDAGKLYHNDLSYVAQGVYLARNMASEPGKSIYPQAFVDVVKKAFKGVDNIDIDVLELNDMRKNNMGALIGVGQGSIHDPRLLVIEYNGADDDSAPLALVGKGITFDTGGISIKQNSGMWAMKSDLSGAAAVAGAVFAAAQRGEKINLVGLMPLAENMPAEDAIRPGDVLETMQGTTIEIISTDAEGRLILADAVTYAQQEFNPNMLVNIATLTGSAARALSDEYAALITRDWALSERMMMLGKQAGEQVWPLPLHPNHLKQISSDIADIKNSGAGNPGASIGAAVVGTFIDESLPWVHLDIAGVDYLSEATDTVPKGAAGWGVRFMDEIVRDEASK